MEGTPGGVVQRYERVLVALSEQGLDLEAMELVACQRKSLPRLYRRFLMQLKPEGV